MNDEKNTKAETGAENQGGGEKTYTQAEVERMIQSEADKRVTQALETQRKKMAEAEKLAGMSAEDKLKYEYQQKLDELNQREAELNHKEMLAETVKQLAEKKLPAAAADFLVALDADTTNDNIKKFEKMFNDAITAEIKSKMGGSAPSTSSVESGGITKEQFSKMTLAQRSELLKNDPDIFNALCG